MNERLLAYTLKEVEQGVLMMARDNSTFHVFDLGAATGEDYVFVMAILPKRIADNLPLIPSAPLDQVNRA